MNTFLFAWNPKKWPWKHLEENFEELKTTGITKQMWSCRSHRTVRVGDRAFLIRLGGKDNGIIGAGYIVTEPFLAKHWDGSGRLTERVMIDFEDLVNRNEKPIISIDELKLEFFNQHWSTQASGIIIKNEVADKLESKLFYQTNKYVFNNNETSKSKKIKEGNPYCLTITKYERNQHARNECLKHFGYLCQVCNIDFEKNYGEIGKEFIHVHHLTKISSIGKTYEIDPIKDLIPLCPNCHSMVHRRQIPYTIIELKEIYSKSTSH
jgi:5-methylcytosine-specific restriction protein A